MALAINHNLNCAIATDPAATAAGKITPTNWNDTHAITQATGKVLGRATAGTGVTEELTRSQVLDLADAATWGDILFRGTAAWTRLAVGATKTVLQSAGAGADLVWTAVANIAGGNTFSGAQIATVTALTSVAGSIALDFSANNEFSHTFTENTALANPSNIVAGQSGSIKFTQHVSSPKTLSFGAYWKFPGGTVPTVTATNSAADTLYYSVRSSMFIECTLQKGFA